MRPCSQPARSILGLALTLGLAGCEPQAKPETTASRSELVERGKYLVTVMDCGGCHDTGVFTAQTKAETQLAGSDEGFELPGLGVFYPPNLTPDPTGLANWSEAQIVKALRAGERPDGRRLAPIMPWRAYANLTDRDAAAIAAYLKSLKPVSHKVAGPATAETAAGAYLTLKAPAARVATTSAGAR